MHAKSWNEPEVRDTLARLIASPELAAAPRQRGLLEFLVEETLAGRAGRIKAFTIATSLFGRDADFDPQKSSIVRVEALRLRRILENYNSGPGASEPLQFRLNRGSYVPEFIRNPATTVAFASALDAASPATSEIPAAEGHFPTSVVEAPRFFIQPPKRSYVRPAMLLSGPLLISTIALAWVLPAMVPSPLPELTDSAPPPRSGVVDSRVTLTVDPVEPWSSDAAAVESSRRLTHDIQDTLSLFENPRIVEAAQQAPASDYRLTGRMSYMSADSVSLSFRMVRQAAGTPAEIVWASRYENIPVRELTQGGRPEAVVRLTTTIAQSYGAIFADLRSRMNDSPELRTGFGCVVLAYDALDEPTVANFAEARSCLKKTLATDTDFASGMAALSYLDVAEWQYGLNDSAQADPLEQARDLTHDATRIAPSKGRMHAAKFWVRFASGRFDDAFDEARTAVELNPYASDTLARVGAAHLLRGNVREGRSLVEQAAATNSARPSWQDFFLFLGAYLDNDQDSAARIAMRNGVSQTPLGNLARIIIYRQKGDAIAAGRELKLMNKAFPGFAKDPRAMLDRWQMSAEVRDRLLADARIQVGQGVVKTP